MSEIALVSARKSRLESQAEKGDKEAEEALELSNNPEKFLISRSDRHYTDRYFDRCLFR